MSDWSYIVLKPAVRYLKRMPKDEQQRVVNALDALALEPQSADVKPLKGRPGLRLRVGRYRVLLRVDEDHQQFIVTQIGPRGDVYK